ncbi:hypothetical protein G9A89_003299 [Geosiphon pyriformis]|nr:hypothetical protein G9A89_003299 [Geosiphon pyriformis]
MKTSGIDALNIFQILLGSDLGFPFLTVAITISSMPAAGNRFKRLCIPLTEIMYKFLAPELSAQFINEPTRPKIIRYLSELI